jgi:LEA14-like dessication related protein
MKIKHIILIVLLAAIAVGIIAMVVAPHKIFAAYIPAMQQIETVDMVIYPDRAKMKFKIAVLSDGPIEALLDSISYKVYFDSTEFSKGSQSFNRKMDKDSNDTITLPLEMKFKMLDRAFDKFENQDSTDLKIKFAGYFHLPIIGATTVPMDVAIRIASPVRPKIKIVNVDLEKLRLHKVEASVDMMIINENQIGFKVENMKLYMKMPGLLEGNIIHMEAIDIKSRDSSLFTMPIKIDEMKLVKTAWKFLFDKEELEYVLTGSMDLILPVEEGVADKMQVNISTKGLTPFAGKDKKDEAAKKQEQDKQDKEVKEKADKKDNS